MQTQVINFRASPQLIKQIENIVKDGQYKDRTEAINEALRLLVRRHFAIKAQKQTLKLRQEIGKQNGNLTKALFETRAEENL